MSLKMPKNENEKKRWDVIPKYFDKKSKNIVGVEVGVWRGLNASRLLKDNKNLFLYLVDRWKYPDENDSYFHGKDTMVTKNTQKDFDKAYEETISNLKKYKGRFRIIKTDSISASESFEDNSLDFVFIDGDHTYEGALKDIESWYPKVKNGGFISGHDYDGPERHFGVKDAVDDFFGKENIIKDDNHTWFYKKKSS